ncbi:MAG: RIO1 family regulatory kinase/ATPase, partial [Nitrososphaerota archaeon]
MQFLGKNGTRYPTLEEVELEPNDYEKIYPLILENMKKLYQKADLIHADMSQYNVFVTDTLSIYFIDLSQAVHTSHPLAEVFLERDVKNITKFFEKKGINVKPPEEVIKWIKS